MRQDPLTHTHVATPPAPQRRRRPSGEPPPLPRELGSARYWIALGAFGALLWSLLWIVGVADDVIALNTRVDTAVLNAFARTRTEPLTALMRALNAIGSRWTVAIGVWLTCAVCVVFKRWRQLFVMVPALYVVGVATQSAMVSFMRPRPGVERIGDWSGFAFPSLPVGAVTAALVAACYMLLPAGRVRSTGKWIAAALIGTLALARMYLGVDHPTDIVVAVAVGWAVPLIGFRSFAPNAVFPVTYRRRRSAHLPIDPRRLQAIRAALRDQLGVALRSVEPFNLEQSFGSTPLKIQLDDQANTVLFGKLYAASHMRADRWYKLWRTLRYGRLEDEGRFSTVRRLVQYEDYMLRVMREAGLPVPRAFGFVSITPEREYLLVTELFDGAKESGKADINEAVIDDGLRVVRQLWLNGLAHRDIKPANVLVRDDKVLLIDVAFAQIRPSPWREAVDLANMMIVLSLRTTPELVYERALRYFTPQEIAEALASVSEAGRPSLHQMLRADGRDLLATFRELAPPHPPVKVQRWSARRIGLTGAVAVTGVLVIALALANLSGGGVVDPPIRQVFERVWPPRPATSFQRQPLGTIAQDPLSPVCDDSRAGTLMLMAQAVPEAALIPCIADPPAGWSLSGIHIREGGADLRFDSDRAGTDALTVRLLPRCVVDDAVEVPSDEEGTRRYERIDSIAGEYRGVRSYVFDGGCVRYDFNANGPGWATFGNDASAGLSFVTRHRLARRYAETTGGLQGP
jgi:tRNA A-37 threonylcarbamoyl transferase component Bud32/membrane-associated phospholipid phosphatase